MIKANDAFEFVVEDVWGNRSNPQEFIVAWSSISFDFAKLDICEEESKDKNVEIKLKRFGDIFQSAFVTIRVNAKELDIHDDWSIENYGELETFQIQFDPTEKEKSFTVIIKADRLEEANGELAFTIEDPVNTILGSKKRSRLRVFDSTDRACSSQDETNMKQG